MSNVSCQRVSVQGDSDDLKQLVVRCTIAVALKKGLSYLCHTRTLC